MRGAIIARRLVLLVATVTLAACGLTPDVTGSPDLGVPAVIGEWTVSDVTPDPQTDFGKALADFASVFLEAAGATTATGEWAIFEVRDAEGLVARVDGYRVVAAEPDTLWSAADSIGFGDASAVAITPAGWDLRHVGDGGGWVAVRNDRLFTFSGGPPEPSQDQVQTFLDALN